MPSIRTYVEMRKTNSSPSYKLMFFKTTSIFGRVVLGLLLLIVFAGIAFSEEKRIVIVKSSESPFFQAAAEGVKKEIRRGTVNPVFIEYDLSVEFPDKKQIDQIRELNPNLIVTIGSKSTAFLSKHIRDIPIVFSAVLNPISSGFVPSMRSSGSNLTGSSLDIPISTQLEKFKLIVPGMKKVGVICTRDSEPVVQEAERVCREIGLELVPAIISSEREIPEAIEKLGQKVDGLWAVADTLVFTPQSTQYLLLYTLRQGIPFQGPFTSFVQAGALFTLAWNDKDVGRQAGELAVKVLAGENPKYLPITTPRMIYLILNLRTAEQINLDIPPHIVSVAKEVYQ
jgi:putative ABC transport system substrate-binding protein